MVWTPLTQTPMVADFCADGHRNGFWCIATASLVVDSSRCSGTASKSSTCIAFMKRAPFAVAQLATPVSAAFAVRIAILFRPALSPWLAGFAAGSGFTLLPRPALPPTTPQMQALAQTSVASVHFRVLRGRAVNAAEVWLLCCVLSGWLFLTAGAQMAALMLTAYLDWPATICSDSLFLAAFAPSFIFVPVPNILLAVALSRSLDTLSDQANADLSAWFGEENVGRDYRDRIIIRPSVALETTARTFALQFEALIARKKASEAEFQRGNCTLSGGLLDQLIVCDSSAVGSGELPGASPR